MDYFDWYGERLFRRDPVTHKQERWDEDAGGWVDVGNFVTRGVDFEMDSDFNQVDEATAKKTYGDAFATGKSVTPPPASDAKGDSRFNALTVDDLSRIQGYIMGGASVDQYIEDNKFEPMSDQAAQARHYAELMQASMDNLEPGTTMHVPGEWT